MSEMTIQAIQCVFENGEAAPLSPAATSILISDLRRTAEIEGGKLTQRETVCEMTMKIKPVPENAMAVVRLTQRKDLSAIRFTDKFGKIMEYRILWHPEDSEYMNRYQEHRIGDSGELVVEIREAEGEVDL